MLTFEFNEDIKECQITNYKTSEVETLYENAIDYPYLAFNKTFIVSVKKDRGWWYLWGLEFSIFDFPHHEISVIYNNIKVFVSGKLITIILEIKLNKTKLSKLIEQIQRDNSILKNIIENEI